MACQTTMIITNKILGVKGLLYILPFFFFVLFRTGRKQNEHQYQKMWQHWQQHQFVPKPVTPPQKNTAVVVS